MKKNYYSLLIIAVIFFSCTKEQVSIMQSSLPDEQGMSFAKTTSPSMPVTAVSFPKEVIPVDGGQIEFWAKLNDYGGNIRVGGYEPYFFQIHDNLSTFHMGFNANDGAANGGLTGVVGSYFFCGTGPSKKWTYNNIYGAGRVNCWHQYIFKWNKEGLPDHNQQKLVIYIDGIVSSTSWHANGDQNFKALTGGTFNLITTGGPVFPGGGEVAMQDLKIFDKNGTLLLSNKLGSQQDIENSIVGLNGSFNGGGAAHFVPGRKPGTTAVSALPVKGL